MVVYLQRILVLCALAVVDGCIVVPVPTPEWGDAPISAEQHEALEEGIGTLSRRDIKSMLGSPQQSYLDGRVFVYEWAMKQGVWIVMAGSGYYADGSAKAGTSEHRLCLRFDEDGTLIDTKHIDSALGLTSSNLAKLLDDWIGTSAAEGAAPGFSGVIDPDEFSMTPRPGDNIGIMIYTDGKRKPSCFDDLGKRRVKGYRLYSHDRLRDAFFPWLESPWYDRLPAIASGPALADARRESGLRFIVVVSSSDNPFSNRLCSLTAPYTLSCYSISYEDESGRVALIDLQADPDAVAARSARILRIPKFPTSRQQACHWLMVYPARDIERVLTRQEFSGD